MKTVNLAFLGFGNVATALARLLDQKAPQLASRYGLRTRVTGVRTRRLGSIARPEGLDPAALAQGVPGASLPADTSLEDWLRATGAHALIEMTSLNPETGQPAIDHLRSALSLGLHAITANKGPVVYAHRDLTDLARHHRVRFLFEAAVMDGAPIFSLFRESLPAAELRSFRGILNSTTNFILGEMESGSSFEAAVARAQRIGIAETDPAADVDGWDAAVKVAALVTVVMGIPLLPRDVEREGIRGLSGERVRAARQAGRPYKLVCVAERSGDGVRARVGPEQLPLADPLASVSGTSSAIHFGMDVLPGLTIVEHSPGPETTAYGVLSDLLRAVGALD